MKNPETKIQRYKWAGNLARVAMGKRKVWGGGLVDAANEDPLAWWCLTEAIATGGPKFKQSNL